MALSVLPEEVVSVDVTSSLSSLFYPVVKLTLVTALCWMGIGFIDQPQPNVVVDTGMRSIFVALWALLALWAFVLPVARSRRRRLILTDKRLILRAPALRGHSESIPLGAVQQVLRKGSTLKILVAGQQHYVVVEGIPYARRIAALIEHNAQEYRREANAIQRRERSLGSWGS